MNLKVKTHTILILLTFSYSLAFSQVNEAKQEEYKKHIFEKGNTISMFNMFREQSYILPLSGLGNLEPLIFEADIIPYFLINLSQNARWGMEISPRIIIRMLNKHSHPVQTPSYMPKATVFYQFPDSHRGKRDFFTFLSWMHHSNGQDGDFYNDDGTINTASGSFTTYWLEGGLFLSRKSNVLKFNTNYIKLYASYNYHQEKELEGIYGHLRFYANIKNTMQLSDAFRTIVASKKKSNKSYAFDQSIKIGWIADELNDTKTIDWRRLIFNYTLSFKPVFLKDVNFFVHYYYGQDYYNIQFERQLSVIRFGISSKSNILF